MEPVDGALVETLGADAVQPGAEHMRESVPLVEFMDGTLTVTDVFAIVTYLPA